MNLSAGPLPARGEGVKAQGGGGPYTSDHWRHAASRALTSAIQSLGLARTSWASSTCTGVHPCRPEHQPHMPPRGLPGWTIRARTSA